MEQLVRLRKRKGYSQRALAKESGVSPATIYELEDGRREPNPSTLRKLAETLEVEVADLVEGQTTPKEAAPSYLQPHLNGFVEEERRTRDLEERSLSYLRGELGEIRGYAEAARWALEDVPSFSESKGGVLSITMLNSWSHYIHELRHYARNKTRKWEQIVDEVSGQEMPTSERELLDRIRRELERYVDSVEKLGSKFNNQWRRFQDNEELSPDVHTLRAAQESGATDDARRSKAG